MNEWQPIETAPKDGQQIIGWSCLANTRLIVHFGAGEWWTHPTLDYPAMDNEITLWQPLPSPPAHQSTKSEG